MIVKLLTEHHLEFLNLKGGCRGSSESTLRLVKMLNSWKSHATAQIALKSMGTNFVELLLILDYILYLASFLCFRANHGHEDEPERQS